MVRQGSITTSCLGTEGGQGLFGNEGGNRELVAEGVMALNEYVVAREQVEVIADLRLGQRGHEARHFAEVLLRGRERVVRMAWPQGAESWARRRVDLARF
jgi:hypothetical protein